MLTYQQNTQQFLQEHSAVNRLLEMAERTDLTEDLWNKNERLRLLGSLLSKRVPQGREQQSRQFRSLQKKKYQQEKLKDLMRQQLNPQSKYLQNRYMEEDHMRLSMELSKNIKIRPINSNLTFYNPNKEKSMSQTFYRNNSRIQQQILPNNHTGNELKSFNSTSLNRVVYFKSNKAETVRQLLKEMKHQRESKNQIVLHSRSNCEVPIQKNSFGRLDDGYESSGGQRQDQIIVIGGRREEENIWKKKIRIARSRRMSGLSSKNNSSKKLILRD